MWSRFAAGDNGRIGRFHGNGSEISIFRANISSDARNGPARADASDKDVDPTAGIIPNFLARGPLVNFRVGGILELLWHPTARNFRHKFLGFCDRAFQAVFIANVGSSSLPGTVTLGVETYGNVGGSILYHIALPASMNVDAGDVAVLAGTNCFGFCLQAALRLGAKCINTDYTLWHTSYAPGGGCSYEIRSFKPLCLATAWPFRDARVNLIKDADGSLHPFGVVYPDPSNGNRPTKYLDYATNADSPGMVWVPIWAATPCWLLEYNEEYGWLRSAVLPAVLCLGTWQEQYDAGYGAPLTMAHEDGQSTITISAA